MLEALASNPDGRLVVLADQKNGRIIVRDLLQENWTDDTVLWEYRPDEIPRESRKWMAEVRLRDCPYYGGRVLMYTAPEIPHSKAFIVSVETKKTLFETNFSGCNPHAVEVLPNGVLAVGSTNDGMLLLYAASSPDPVQTLELRGDNGRTDVHGVLWDPERETLWVSGGNVLRAFSVLGTAQAPELVLRREYHAPNGSMHDLLPLFGDSNSLLLTTDGGVMRFDKAAGAFDYAYSGNEVGRRYGYVPGCAAFADGVFAVTAVTPESRIYQNWDTNQVRVYLPAGDGTGTEVVRIAPNDSYYKVRPLDFRYQ